MGQLKVSGIIKESVVDGPGLRYAIFTQGCFHKCEGCQNPQTHDPQGGYLVDTDNLYEEIISNTIISGVTFTGGEPFLQSDELANLALKIQGAGFHDMDIIVYTGYTYEEIQNIIKAGTMSYFRLMNAIDYLIDGRFEKDKASLDCPFRGSTNQRIIDVKKSRQLDKIITIENFENGG